jgi:prolyl-tRNA synthetase
MGGELTIDFLAPSGSGENTLVRCERGDYAADAEIAKGVPRAAEFPKQLGKPAKVETPGVVTCEALAEFLGIDLAATSKAMPVTTDEGKVVLALVRGDDRLSESKLLSALRVGSRPSTDEEIRQAFGASGGSLGPIGFSGEVVADETLREGEFVAGANRDGFHLRGVAAGRDYEPRFADIREPVEGDRCPECGGKLQFQTAIEVGHIFNFGDKYSAGLGATFLDEDGKEKPLVGGSYGIGPGRIIAAVIEQRNDDSGITGWPRTIAPYHVHVVALPGLEEQAQAVAATLEAKGVSVLLDDRDLRAGEKFNDADLIGCPVRVTVGKKTLEDGAVDVRDRSTGEERRLPPEEVSF